MRNRKKKQKNYAFFALLFWCLSMYGLTGCQGRSGEFLETEGLAEVTELPEEPEKTKEEKQSEPSPIPEKKEIYVDVCGAVVKPGVYCLDPDSRVFQAIEKAGGFLPEAADTYVNRAQSLGDGQQVYIPTKEEVQNQPALAGAAGKGESSTAEEGEQSKVNLNTADAQALMTLSGIGQSKADAILTYREENGGFSCIEDILKIPGIKEGTFEKIKDNIVV